MHMADTKANVIAVVGGGLVGPLHAILLSQRGFTVDLYEARPDIRTLQQVSGRSISLALSVRGREALRAIGLEETVLENAIPMRARMIHSLSGKLSAQAYGKKNQCSYLFCGPPKLNELLLTIAESRQGISIHFEHKLIRANLEEKTLVFQVGLGKVEKPVKCSFIFGCDGSYSTVRRQMMRWGRLNYSQKYIEHGYKELTMPPTASGEYAIPTNYLHIWPRQEFMMIALPKQRLHVHPDPLYAIHKSLIPLKQRRTSLHSSWSTFQTQLIK